MNIEGEKFNRDFVYEELSSIDKFILSKLQNTIENVTKNNEKYDFANASTHLYNFVYDDFTSWYLELSKVILNGDDEKAKANTRGVLLYCLENIIMLIYPYTPFIAEELYLALPNHKESIMLESYPEVNKAYVSNYDEEIINDLISMIKDVRAFKVDNNLAPNAEIKLSIKEKEISSSSLIAYIKRFTFASNINVTKEDLMGAKIYKYFDLLIEENISNDELKAKLEKEIKILLGEVKRCEGMLNNPNFISKAPEAKINAERAKYESYKAKLDSYKTKLDGLK